MRQVLGREYGREDQVASDFVKDCVRQWCVSVDDANVLVDYQVSWTRLTRINRVRGLTSHVKCLVWFMIMRTLFLTVEGFWGLILILWKSQVASLNMAMKQRCCRFLSQRLFACLWWSGVGALWESSQLWLFLFFFC